MLEITNCNKSLWMAFHIPPCQPHEAQAFMPERRSPYSFIILFLLIIRFVLKYLKNKLYPNGNWSVIDIIKYLGKERRLNSKYCFQLIFMIIGTYYIFIISASYLFRYSELVNFPYIILPIVFLLIFSISVNKFFTIIMGFQDNVGSYFASLILTISFLSIYFFIIIGGKILEMDYSNLDNIFSMLGIFIIPVIASVISAFILYYVNRISVKPSFFEIERTSENKGWNKFFTRNFNLGIFGFIIFPFFFFYYNLNFLFLVITINPIKSLTLQDFIFLWMFFLITMIIFLIPLLISIFLEPLIKKIFDWKEFFDVYYGRFDHQLNRLNKLVKTKGKCIAISNRLECDESNAELQFLMIHGTNKPIDVIRLKEYVPFSGWKSIIRENDELLIIGKVKCLYDPENKSEQYPVLFAYHIAPYKKK